MQANCTRWAAGSGDVVRIDHFRAISSYWVVPRGRSPPRCHWAPGPGPALLQAPHTAAPELQLIAEDLGTIDDDVRRLVARSGCPGMRVLLFGFDPAGTSEHRPDRVRAHSVCYVGTHDNAPAVAWAACGGTPTMPCAASACMMSRACRSAARRHGLARGAVHRADAGRARPRRREPHEHARHGLLATGSGGCCRSGGRADGRAARAHAGCLPGYSRKGRPDRGVRSCSMQFRRSHAPAR